MNKNCKSTNRKSRDLRDYGADTGAYGCTNKAAKRAAARAERRTARQRVRK